MLLASSLTGCSSVTSGTVDQLCKSWVPIYPSKDDRMTKGTVEQIAANNVASDVWCGVRPVPKEAKPTS